MKLEQYKKECTRTIKVLPTLEENMLHVAYGISTEVGELHDIYKKELAYGKQIDIVNLKEELGDILWYVLNGLTFCEITDSNVIEIQQEIDSHENDTELLTCIQYLSESSCNIMSNLYQVDKNDIKYRFSGVLFNVLSICQCYKFDIEEIMDMNINKLKKRFPEKFTQEAALNRNLDEERKILEDSQNEK